MGVKRISDFVTVKKVGKTPARPLERIVERLLKKRTEKGYRIDSVSLYGVPCHIEIVKEGTWNYNRLEKNPGYGNEKVVAKINAPGIQAHMQLVDYLDKEEFELETKNTFGLRAIMPENGEIHRHSHVGQLRARHRPRTVPEAHRNHPRFR